MKDHTQAIQAAVDAATPRVISGGQSAASGAAEAREGTAVNAIIGRLRPGSFRAELSESGHLQVLAVWQIPTQSLPHGADFQTPADVSLNIAGELRSDTRRQSRKPAISAVGERRRGRLADIAFERMVGLTKREMFVALVHAAAMLRLILVKLWW